MAVRGNNAQPKRAGRKRLLGLAALAIATVFTLGLQEAAIRILGDTDDDGNFTFMGMRLRPYHVPVTRIRSLLDELDASLDDATIIYDPELGWAPRPRAAGAAGYYYDSVGIRSGKDRREVSLAPSKGRFRVVLFGDSFAHGSDVSFEESLGEQLERELEKRGRPAEVLNFGVPGYGMGQALLRFRRHAERYAPDLVLFGFQPENIQRSVNLVRPLFFRGTGIPFSKPRIVLGEAGLFVVNQPAIRGEAYLRVLEDLPSWDLIKYEAFYDANDYAERPVLASRLFAVVDKIVSRVQRPSKHELFYRKDSDAGKLAIAIIEAFSAESRAFGARFAVLHIPTLHDLNDRAAGGMRHRDIWQELVKHHDVVDPLEVLASALEQEGPTALFIRPTGGHYNARASQRVAAHAASALAAAP